MKVFGIAGWKDSGKTTLVTRLIPALIGHGLSVSTLKHAHHAFDIDQPGKDSYRHREAGAAEVLVASARRWALLHEHRDGAEPDLAALLAHLAPVDVVLVEGFKREAIDKLEVWSQATGKPLLCRDDPHIVAVASDAPIPNCPVPRLDREDVPAIAAFIVARYGLGSASP